MLLSILCKEDLWGMKIGDFKADDQDTLNWRESKAELKLSKSSWEKNFLSHVSSKTGFVVVEDVKYTALRNHVFQDLEYYIGWLAG